jgi:DNA-binding IclR family transcriptional regulator
LVRAAAPCSTASSSASGESVLLAVRVGLERVIVDTRDAQVRAAARVARTMPAAAALRGSGPLPARLLPERGPARRPRPGLPRFTEHTVASHEALARALDEIRKEHVYVAKHSYVEGVYSIASPILGTDRLAVASLSVVGAVARLDPATEERMRAEVRDAAAEIARYLT